MKQTTHMTLQCCDTETSVQVLYSTLYQLKSGSACHMTRSADHRRHSVVIHIIRG